MHKHWNYLWKDIILAKQSSSHVHKSDIQTPAIFTKNIYMFKIYVADYKMLHDK